MANYSWMSVIALFCYIFLMMALMAAKKTKVISSFMMLQLLLIFWTGGSFFMRSHMWPSVNFWHYVSLFGILLLPFGFFRFVLDFLEDKKKHGIYFWLLYFLICFIVNGFTGLFIPEPVIVPFPGGESFVYHYSNSILLLLIPLLIMVGQMGTLIYRHCKGNTLIFRQLFPILLGAAIMVLGHIFTTTEWFSGFPIDILSGLVYGILTFYALYAKKMFKMTLLISRGNCYALAVLISVAGLSNSILPLKYFLHKYLNADDRTAIVIISLCFMLAVVVICQLVKRFLDSLFVKEEQIQAESLKNFNYNISKTLNMDEILEELVEVIRSTVLAERVFVCIRQENGWYQVEKASSPLHEKNFMLYENHPLITCLKQTDGCLLMKDFRRTIHYKSVWEEEKQMFAYWGIECLLGLRDGEDLVGVVFLSGKRKGREFDYDDLSFLLSVGSVCTMAVKNSRLYETAYYEARYDDLTGLLNRKYFYELIENEFERCKDHALALVMLSVDDFKLYNQLYGAQEGDVALQKIAKIMQATVPDQGAGFRLNGKEFAVILPGYDIFSAKVLAENICMQVRTMENTTGEYSMKTLTMSGGVCAAPYMASSVNELIANADMAVYSVKRAGKNAVIMYTEEVERKNQGGGGINSRYDDYASTIIALTAAIDTKDHYTFSHSQNVAYYAVELAKAYGMSEEHRNTVKEAGLLHDIGKIGIPEGILNKPGKLNEEEYQTMKGHVESSIGIIRHLPSLDYVIPAVISHHERYDGFGYPRGISGEDIPLMGRMLCIADSFDAMVSERSYKAAMPVEKALRILEEECGRQFDPKLAPMFVSLVEKGEIQIQKKALYT